MAKKSSYYNGNKDMTDNDAIDNLNDKEVVDSFSYDYGNEVEETMENANKANESETKKCKVISVIPNAICVDFCGFGVSIEVKNPQDYKKNKVIPVSYSGKIGTSDFKIWVD